MCQKLYVGLCFGYETIGGHGDDPGSVGWSMPDDSFLASALAKGGLIRVYKPIAQLSLFLESLGECLRIPRLAA